MANEAILEIKLKGITEARTGMDDLSEAINKQRDEIKRLKEEQKLNEKVLSDNKKALQQLNNEYAEGTITQQQYEAEVNAVKKSNEEATNDFRRNGATDPCKLWRWPLVPRSREAEATNTASRIA